MGEGRGRSYLWFLSHPLHHHDVVCRPGIDHRQPDGAFALHVEQLLVYLELVQGCLVRLRLQKCQPSAEGNACHKSKAADILEACEHRGVPHGRIEQGCSLEYI